MKPRKVSRIGKRTLQLVMREMEACAFEAMEWNVYTWAEKAGVSYSAVYRLLNGTTRFPQFETIVRLASALHTDIVPMESGSVELRLKEDPKIKMLIEG
jgi:predicted transcriptional regulator